MDGLVLLGLIVLGAAIATPIAAFVAPSRTRRLQNELGLLRADVIRLRGEIRPAQAPAPNNPAPPAPSPPLAPAPIIRPGTAEPPKPPEPIAARAGAEPPALSPPSPPRATVTATPGEGAPVSESASADWGRLSDRFERLVAANWLIWLGAAALALGGVFLVRYAWEQGYFGPTARTIAAFVAGAAMLGASEWFRRKVSPDAPGQIGRTPLAVAAAGLLTLYAAVYAAGPLYKLIGPVGALVSFVMVSALAVGLALLHGPFLAALGFIGGYAAPILVGGNTPEPLLVLGYALAVTAAILFLVRALNWRSMVWIGLAGAGFWMVISFTWLDLPTGALALALYLTLLTLFATALAWPMADTPPLAAIRAARDGGSNRRPSEGAASIDQTVIAAYGFWILASVGLLVGLAEQNLGRVDPLLGGLGVLVLGGVVAGSSRPGFELLPFLSLLLGAATVAIMPLYASDAVVPPAGPFLQRLSDPSDAFYRFGLFAIGSALALGAGGWLGMRGVARKASLAIASAYGPLLIGVLAYLRLGGAADPLPWGLIAALLATLNLAALEGLHRAKGGMDSHGLAASAYALAAFAASMLAVMVMLPPVWMTALFALHLPAIALLDRRFNLPALRLAASIAAIIVTARLAWPDRLLSYAISPTPIFNEFLILFGVPILCFWGAARIFARSLKSGEAPLVQALDVGALTLLAGLVSVEIRHLATRGDLAAAFQGVAEMGAYATAWTGLALGIAARITDGSRLWLRIAERVVFVIAIGVSLLGLGVISNPLISQAAQPWALDGPPVLNLLGASYLPAAALMIGLSLMHRRKGRLVSSHTAGFTALGLILLYVTLEVRNAFHVDLSFATGGPVFQAETYAYSIAWLAVASLTLLVGIWRKRVAIRHAAMAVLALAVLKVFVFDMASLDGVLRAVSFLGLGVALIAIAFIYQKLVLRPTPRAPAA